MYAIRSYYALAHALVERERLMLETEQEQGGKPKEIARRVAEAVTGWTAKEVYALMRSR